MNNMKRSTTLANSRSPNFHSFFKILKTGFQAKTCWVSLLLIANWCVGVPTRQPVSVWYLKNYHYNHEGNLPPKNDDSKPLSLQADQYLLIGSATDRPADAPPLLFYLHHTHNKDNISRYNQESEFPFDPGLPLWLCPENTHHNRLWSLPKSLDFPPFTGMNITITVLVGLASLTLWLACSPGPGAAASKACHSLFPTLTAYTYFPTTARSVIWHFLKGIWILNLVPPSSIDHIITATSPSVGPVCFPNPARSQLFHWIWHHQLTETDKTLRCSGKILFSKNNWRNPFHASIIISETPNCTRGYKICKWRLHDNLVGPMCYNGIRGKCSYIEFLISLSLNFK